MDIGSLIEQHGYLALAAGSAIEGETFVVFAGFAAHRGYLSLPLVVLLAGMLIFSLNVAAGLVAWLVVKRRAAR